MVQLIGQKCFSCYLACSVEMNMFILHIKHILDMTCNRALNRKEIRCPHSPLCPYSMHIKKQTQILMTYYHNRKAKMFDFYLAAPHKSQVCHRNLSSSPHSKPFYIELNSSFYSSTDTTLFLETNNTVALLH